MKEGLSRSFGTAANLLKEFRPHRYTGGFPLISSHSLCIQQAALRTGSRVVQRNYFKGGWALASGISDHLVSGSLLGCVAAVLLSMHKMFSLPLSLHSHFSHMMKYLVAIQRDEKSGIDYLSHSSTLTHMRIFQLLPSAVTLLNFESGQHKHSRWEHVCTCAVAKPSSQRKTILLVIVSVVLFFCLVGFCAEEARKLHDAVSHRCALRYKAMKNRVGFMTKNKCLHEQGPAIQYFLVNWHHWRNSTLLLMEGMRPQVHFYKQYLLMRTFTLCVPEPGVFQQPGSPGRALGPAARPHSLPASTTITQENSENGDSAATMGGRCQFLNTPPI